MDFRNPEATEGLLRMLSMGADASATDSHSSSSAYVNVHPDDSTVPSVFRGNPGTFKPRTLPPEADSNDRWVLPWGIRVDYHASMMRRMQTQFLYTDRDTPEVQFVKALAARKLQSLRQVPPAQTDLVIEIELDTVRPRVWRRVRVSARTPLAVLVDKVLLPLMGFDRNYHGWLIMDPCDHTVFGPEPNNGAIDMMHLCAWAIDVIDAAAAKTTLGHLMAKPGDVLYFCYDLGDRWRHTIKVVESMPPAESKGKVVVLDGAMQCPPEDSNGLPGMGNDCYQDFLDLIKANPGSAAARKALQGAAAATNYRAQPGMPPPGPFDVWTFDKRRAQARLEAAFKSKGSTGGSKQVLTPLTAYDLDSLGALFGKGPAAGQTRVSRQTESGAFEVQTVSNRRDRKEDALCASCGAPQAAQLCSGCRAVRYCGESCQRQDWKHGGHRARCRAMKQEQADAKRAMKAAKA